MCFWRGQSSIVSVLANKWEHQTGCIPQVNPSFDTQSGVISPRCKYLLCNKRGNSTEIDNYLLLWRWQNAISLTMCNWWLFHRASKLIWMCFCLSIYLSAFLPRRAWAQTELRLRQTGSLHVTGVQSDPLSTLFIKWSSGISEVYEALAPAKSSPVSARSSARGRNEEISKGLRKMNSLSNTSIQGCGANKCLQ